MIGCFCLAFLLVYGKPIEMRVLGDCLVEFVEEKTFIADDFL